MEVANIFIISLLVSILAAGSIYTRGVTYNSNEKIKKEITKVSLIFMVLTFIVMIYILGAIGFNSTDTEIIESNIVSTEDQVSDNDYVEIVGTVSSMVYTERGLEIKLINCGDIFIITDKTLLEDGLNIKYGSDIKLKYSDTSKKVFNVMSAKLEMVA